jgi:catechol 2,3-dioxygenase-like lactoylglutathione lyase family enzyme
MSTRPKLVGINHVALEVPNLDEALGFYGSIFDFDLRGRLPGMAFIDMGDQFIALVEGRTGGPDRNRHFGLVVDDSGPVRAALEDAGIQLFGRHGINFHDPWGNYVQVVDYRDVQFLKTPEVLRGMGLDGIAKRESALAELREKGLA